MEKLFVNALRTKLAEGTVIHNTNIVANEKISGAPLNGSIAQAIRTIGELDFFGKGEVSVMIGYIAENCEGYILKKDDTIVFVDFNITKNQKNIERIIVNKEEGEYSHILILQAIILLEMSEDLSELKLKNQIIECANTPFLDKEKNGPLFAHLVRTLENAIEQSVYEPYEESEVREDMEFDEDSTPNLLSEFSPSEEVGVTAEAPSETPAVQEEKEEPKAGNESQKAFEDFVAEFNEQSQQGLFDESETSETSTNTEVDTHSETPIATEETNEVVNSETEPVAKEFKEEPAKESVAVNTEVQNESSEITGDYIASKIESLIDKGHTPVEIAELSNVSITTIYSLQNVQALRDSGKNPRMSTLKKIFNAITQLEGTPVATPAPTPSPELKAEVQEQEQEQKFETASTLTPVSNPSNIDEIVSSAVAKVLESVVPLIQQQNQIPQVVKEPQSTIVEFDLLEAKKQRPLFFDDTWVTSTLKEFEGIEDRDIEDVIKSRKETRERILKECPEAIFDIQERFEYTGYTEPVETLIDSVLEDLNLLFKGEAGSGKTTLIQSGSCLFNLPLYTINGSDDSDIETIVGYKEIDVHTGSIVFKEGYLVKAMRVGGIFYSDEANMIRPNILSILNGALDHRRELYIQFIGERIKANKDFRFMAAINEDYEDTRQMNRATLDRSIAMEMTYMTVEQLKNYLEKIDPDMSKTDVRLLTQIATALQQGVRDELISPEVASIRNILSLQKMVHRRDFNKAIKRIIDKYPKEDRPAIIGVLSAVERLNISAEDIIGR